jgi:hypothetical protein
MIPLVTALATPPPSCSPSQPPSRFITPAISSATRGVSARVETEVAMALAESWKPFVYAKPRATRMTTMSQKLSTVVQDSLTAMVSMVFATCSKSSAACSRVSTTSLSLSTVIASYSPENRWASSRR